MTYLENNTYLRPDKSLLNTFTITTVNTKLEKIVNEPEIPKKKIQRTNLHKNKTWYSIFAMVYKLPETWSSNAIKIICYIYGAQ